MNYLRYPFTAEEIVHAVTSHASWLSRTLSWTSGPGTYEFSYYACWVDELQRWFLTGAGDWYAAKGGITTEQLADLLNKERPKSVWLSKDWTEVHG